MLGKENDLLAFYMQEHLSPEDLAAARAAAAAAPLARLPLAKLAEVAASADASAKRESAAAKAASLGALATLQAVVTQAGLRLQAVKQTAHDFKQTVIQGGVSAATGRVASEAVVRFFEESLRKRRGALEKLETKCATIHAQLRRERGAGGGGGEGSSDLLRYIVFHQLKIEISQARASLSEKTRELLRLKLSWGLVSNLLASLKRAWLLNVAPRQPHLHPVHSRPPSPPHPHNTHTHNTHAPPFPPRRGPRRVHYRCSHGQGRHQGARGGGREAGGGAR